MMLTWISSISALLLAVNAEISLVIRPEGRSQSQPAGTGFVLTCQGEAPDRPELFSEMRWIGPKGEVMAERSSGTVEVSRPSSSTLVLVFNNPSTEETGTYNCTALYDNTQSLVASVNLVFYQDITWENCDLVQPLVLNTEGRIHCRVSANPSATYSWVKNKDGTTLPLKDSDRYIVDPNGVTINTVNHDDAGEYVIKAMVSQTGRFQSRLIKVEVYVPPEITELEESLEVVEGEKAVLSCKATGFPNPKYSWFGQNKRELNGLEGYQVDEDQGSLTFAAVKKEDEGSLTCKATNEAGVSERSLSLSVIVKPKITSFKNVTIEENGEAILECVAEGEPGPQVSIRKEGHIQPFNDQDERARLQLIPDSGKTTLKLTIDRAIRSDDGLYFCVAENRGASVEQVGHLTVEFGPVMTATPSALVKTWSGHPVNLTCIAEAIPNATLTWWFQGQEIRPTDTNYVIYGTSAYSNLLVRPSQDFTRPPNVYGIYKCTAENKLGSASINIDLQEARIPEMISEVEVDKKTATTITFRIRGPINDGGLNVREYVVQYREENQPLQETTTFSWNEGTNYILENLKPRTKYLFKFAARNDVGIGTWTAERPISTPAENAPEAPSFITPGGNISRYSNKFEVRWTVPLDNGRPIDYFQLRYFPVEKRGEDYKSMAQDKIIKIDSWQNAPHYMLEDLRPNSYYKVEVRAHNEIGFSQVAYMIFRTAEGSVPLEQGTLRTSDAEIEEASGVSMTAVIVIIITLVVIILLVMDVVCFLRYQWGVLYGLRVTLCGHAGLGAKVKEAATVEDGKSCEELEDKRRTEVDNPAFDGKDGKLTDNGLDGDMKAKTGSKSSIAKDSLV